MESQQKLPRDTIVLTLVRALEPLHYVHAFWEGGAAAFGRIDEWSDIDLYVVVDDRKVEETFHAIEEALKSLSPIKQKYERKHPQSSGLFQSFYKLEDANEYLMIDLAVLTLSSPDKFLEPKMHGNAQFYFNKSSEIKQPPLDKDAMVKKVKRRATSLKAKFTMFNNFIQKEINRGNHLEAMDFYNTVTLATLTEALRIKHNPIHHDFKMHYIHYELPSKTVEKLKHLYFVKDERDLQEKYRQATEWFFEVVSQIDQEEIEKLIEAA